MTHQRIVTWNLQGAITDANDPFLNLVGYSHDDLRAGRLRWPDLSPPELREADQQRLAELHATGQLTPYEQEFVRQDSSRAPVLVGSARFEGSTNEAVSFVLDVARRRALERAQQEFIAMVGHELRNPLASLKAFAQLMHRRGSYDERAVEAIINQSNQLDRLIGDLVDASHLQTGRLDLVRQQVNLIVITAAAADQAQAETAKHRVLVEAPSGPLIGEWDPDRLGQVLRNLLSNAIKYSPDGGDILVRVEPTIGAALVSIRDHGIGIDPTALPRLFDRFYRATPKETSVRGLGLGLFITRELIEAHGGRIWAESEGEGHGSVFFIDLPLRSAPQASSPVEPMHP